MRIKATLCFLVTYIQLSFGLPLPTTHRLEAKIKEGTGFSSPGFENGRYPDRTESHWELYAPHTQKIKIVFEYFVVEYQSHCIWDNVTITRSRCSQSIASGKADAVLCGQLRDYEFDSDKSPVCVTFSSDHMVSRRGFKAFAFAVPGNTENTTDFSSTTSINATESPIMSSVVTQGTTNSDTKNEDSTTIQSTQTPSTTVAPTVSSSSSSSSSLTSSSSFTSSLSVTLPVTTENKEQTSPTVPVLSSTSSQSPNQSSTTKTSTLKSTTTQTSSPNLQSSSSALPNTLSALSSSISSVSSSKFAKTSSSSSSSSSSSFLSSSVLSSSSTSSPISKSSLTSLSPPSTSSLSSATTLKTPSTSTTTSTTMSSKLPSSFTASSATKAPTSPGLSATSEETTSAASILDVIIGEFAQTNVDIVNLNAVIVRSPTDETGRYPLNIHHEFTIFNHQKADIRIEFPVFQIEFHSQCGWDYLQLTLGSDEPYNICGKTPPEAWTTKAETIKVVFHSDHVLPYRGFKMKLTKLSNITSRDTQTSNSSTNPTSVSQESLTTTPTPKKADYTSTLSVSSLPSSLPPQLSSSLLSSSSSSSYVSSSPEPPSSSPSYSSISSSLSSSSSLPTTQPSSSVATTVSEAFSTSAESSNSVPSSHSSSTPASAHSSTTKTTKASSSSSSSSTSSSTESSTGLTTKVSTVLTTDSSAPTPSVLEIVICEFPENNIDISHLNEILVKSPMDEETGKYPLNMNGLLTINNQLQLDVGIEYPHFDLEYHPTCIWDYLQLTFGDEPSIRFCGNTLPKSRTTNVTKIEIEFHSDHMSTLTGFEMKVNRLQSPVMTGTKTTTRFTGFTNKSQATSTTSQGTTRNSAPNESPDHSTGKPTSSVETTPVTSSTNTPSTMGSTSDATESALKGQHSTTPAKKDTTKSTALHQALSSKYPSKVTTRRRRSTSSATVNITKTVQTTTQPKTSSESAAITTASTSFTSKAAKASTMKSSTDVSQSAESTNGMTTTPSESDVKVDQSVMTPKNKATIDKHQSVASTSTSSHHQQMSTSDSLTSLQPTSSLEPSTSSTSKSLTTQFNQTTKTQYVTQTQEHILSTIIKSSSAISSTAVTTLSSATATTSSPQGAIACSPDTMPELMDEAFGYITSPGFGNTEEYPPNSHCQWKINADEKKVIMIIFDTFDVEDSSKCGWDKLVFYETSNDGLAQTKLMTLCGNNIPFTLSSNKSLVIEFKSDSAQHGAGFKFQYIKVDSESGMTYVCPPGKIPCLSSGACIPVEWWCDNTEDCEDRTDELYCHKCPDDQIQCGGGVCLDKSNRCDGIAQCPYATDERECVFVSNSCDHEQPVQVNVKGLWYPLCHDDVAVSSGDDVCKAANSRFTEQLTVENAHSIEAFSLATVESGRLNFTTSSECSSNEVVHLQCSHSDYGRKGKHIRKKRIIGGSVSSKGEWPWSVALRLGNTVLCGGTIIDKLWVVTAGHCVRDTVPNPQILSIIAGMNNINDVDRQIRYVSEVVVHPQYHYIFNADIALLRLQQPLHFDENTKPISLPWDLRQFSPWDLCYVAGFGVSDMKDYYTTVAPNFLRHVKTKIFDLQKCKDIYSTRFSTDERIKDNMLCAGYTSGGMDACKGDSGGGLMCKGADDRWMLAGVVSWGDNCGMTNRPGVYSNVVSFMDWIANTTDPNGDRSITCDFESNGWCGYTDISEGGYVWTRKPGDKYIKGTILYASRTSAANTNAPLEASLLTPTFNNSVDSCLTFSFMFSGNSNITLSVFGVDESDEELPVSDLLWRVTSHYPAKDSWKSSQLDVPRTYMRLKFVSLIENGVIPGLGLDNVTLSTGQCSGSEFVACTFNQGNICSFTQSSGHHSKNWTTVQEISITNTQNNREHYIKAGGDFNTFGYRSFSQMISPEFSNDFTSLPHCITFDFNKKTKSNNNLVLATYVNMGTQLTNQKLVWNSEEAQIGQWISVRVTIPRNRYDHIAFEIRRNEYTQEVIEVCLDDIKVTDGICV